MLVKKMKYDICIKTENINFKYRVSGVIIHNNKVLTVCNDKSEFLCLPGGYVDISETSQEGIKREMKEETGYEVDIDSFLGVIESFYTNKKNIKVHEICFYYLLKPLNDFSYTNYSLIENDNGHEIELSFKWLNINELDKYDIRPEIFKNRIIKGDMNFNYIID